MSRVVLIFTFVILSLFAKELKPEIVIRADGVVEDMLIQDGKIYIATDSSIVNIFDLKSRKKIEDIRFEKIKDFFGELSDVKIFSVDKEGNRLLFVSQGERGFSRVYLYENGKKSLIFDKKDEMAIIKAKFISEDRVILALLGSEVKLYDLKDRKFVYSNQVSESKFSDFVLSEDRKKMFLTDESGSVKVVDTSNGNVLKIFEGQNLDNSYQIVYKAHTIVVASKDRRCGVYRDDGSLAYHKMSDFIVYSVGVSPDGKFGGYASDSKNNITIFNISTKENLYRLRGNKSPISNIEFLDNSRAITTNRDKIKFWNLTE